ncbi:MAG: MFS transporter [Chloroflexota bacterium]|nr:MFS transporter [Chloroflexota bacterium]
MTTQAARIGQAAADASEAQVRSTDQARQGRNRGISTALSNPDYRIFFGGAMATNIGMWMQNVAQGWLVVSLTSSEFYVGLVGFCAMIPTLFLSLFGGVLADRFPKRLIIMPLQAIAFLQTALLATLIATGRVELWHLMVISAANGTVLALNAPAFQAIVPEIVGKKVLRNAIALNSAQFNLTRIIGPSLGGLVIRYMGVAAAYYFNAVSYLALLVAMLFIRPKHEPAKRQTSPDGVFRSLGAALRYVHGHSIIRPVLILAAVQTVFLFPYGTLLPVFAKNVLGLGASGYSLLLVSAGVGALCGSLMLARRSGASGVRWMLGAQVGFALSTSVFAFSTNLWLSMAALVFVGWSLVTFMATGNTVVQSLVPDELRGRVMSVWMLVGLGFIPIGSLQAGTVAALVSPTFALVYGAVVTLICTAVVVSRNRVLLDPEVQPERDSFIVVRVFEPQR